MAFIPNKDRIEAGSRVVATRDLSNRLGTFTRGHTFRASEMDSRGERVLTDDDGRTFTVLGDHGIERA